MIAYQIIIKNDDGEIVEERIFTTRKKLLEFKKEMIEYTASSHNIKIKKIKIY